MLDSYLGGVGGVGGGGIMDSVRRRIGRGGGGGEVRAGAAGPPGPGACAVHLQSQLLALSWSGGRGSN